MPKVVDKEAVRQDILEAFHRLSLNKPLTAISLREIAAEAGLSHSSILRYFHDKNSIMVACVHWASRSFADNIGNWFSVHHLCDFESRKDYLDAFFSFFQKTDACQIRAQDVVMMCALGAYSEEIKNAVREEFKNLAAVLQKTLSREFDCEITSTQITSVCVIFYGIYFSHFSQAIPDGEICFPVEGLLQILES